MAASCWTRRAGYDHAVDALDPADFQQPIHRELYTVIAGLVRSGVPHDRTMVGADLERTGKFAGHRGRQHSRHLANITTRGTPTTSPSITTPAPSSRRPTGVASAPPPNPSPKPPSDFPRTSSSSTWLLSAATQRLANLRGADQ
ncbi:DnaB-like helicase N-terminal domain-containing protein [Rhodococcus sp. WAY2]|uniref:DnaB-like helicase N-terminal domain-containing protein n=1 Tax=Rhodococcus sp. WAY2 TaxID=2663121 RepID=UPI001F201D55|nr:DnaB-like helicase N-terminal domain-containing protein [Rhodococcus sp. WAY2]